MSAALIDALGTSPSLPLLERADLCGFLEPDRHELLFLPGDPAKPPEALDLAPWKPCQPLVEQTADASEPRYRPVTQPLTQALTQ